MIDCTPDPWGVITQFDMTDQLWVSVLPKQRTRSTTSRSLTSNRGDASAQRPTGPGQEVGSPTCYATLDAKLREELMCNRDFFEQIRCLARGTITHDGLPFQLPVEIQSMVYAVILAPLGDEPGQAGRLEPATRSRPAPAIRGFNYCQRVEPYFYGDFMRMIQELSKNPDFKTYPLSTHLTNGWLGWQPRGYPINHRPLRRRSAPTSCATTTSNERSCRMGRSFSTSGTRLFSRQGQPGSAGSDGLRLHQMHRMLPLTLLSTAVKARVAVAQSAWRWIELDRTCQANSLPRI